MKTDDHALTEMALDEISFDGNNRFGRGGKKLVWSRKQFSQLVAAMKKDDGGAQIETVQQPEENDTGAWINVQELVDWSIASLVGKFAMNSGIDLTPQWLIRFESLEEAKRCLMEGWAVDALVGKWDDKI